MYSLYIYRIYFRHKKHSPPLADEKIIAQKYKLKINCEIFTIVFIAFFDFFTYFSLFLSNYIAFYRKMRNDFLSNLTKTQKNGTKQQKTRQDFLALPNYCADTFLCFTTKY